ncbi:MAG: chemotaxis protein CheX [Pseudomonadota bacterium]
MKKTLMLNVTSSIFEVMETMFYFTVEEKDTAASDLSDLFDIQSARTCRITFSGQFSGAIFLLIPKNVLGTMTQNFLGEGSDNLSEELTDGTLKEALNMIAGSALTKFDEKSYMGLGIPEVVELANLSLDEESVIFNTGEGLIASFIQIDK